MVSLKLLLDLIRSLTASKLRTALTAIALLLVIRYLRQQRSTAEVRRRRHRWRNAVQDMQRMGLTPGEFVELRGGKTHYILVGPPDGELIVLFHGYGVFTYVWESLFEALTDQGYRVLAFDFYGFGYSEALKGSTYNVDLFIEQAEELLHKLHVTSKFTLLGHSMGGLLATLFANRFPSRLHRLILTCPAGTPVPKPFSKTPYLAMIHTSTRLAMSPMIGKVIVAGLLRLIAWHMGGVRMLSFKSRNMSYQSLLTSQTKLNRVSSTAAVRAPGGRFLNMMDMTMKGIHFQTSQNARFGSTMVEVLNNLDLFGDWTAAFEELSTHGFPIKVIWGDADEYIPVENCRNILMKAIPDADFTIFQDADHFVFLNNPDEYLRCVLDFMRRHRSLADSDPFASLHGPLMHRHSPGGHSLGQ